MRAVLQIATLAALAMDLAVAIMLYWTSLSAAQDAAGRGMAGGFLILTLVGMAAALAALLLSYWRASAGMAFVALIVVLLPLMPVLLPRLL